MRLYHHHVGYWSSNSDAQNLRSVLDGVAIFLHRLRSNGHLIFSTTQEAGLLAMID